MSDPTQKQSTVTVTLKGTGITPAAVRAVGNVAAIEGGVKVTVDVSGLRGATVSGEAQDSTAEALDAMQKAESFLNRSDLGKADADEGQALLDALNALDERALSDAQKGDLAALRTRLAAKIEELKKIPDSTPTPEPEGPTLTPKPGESTSTPKPTVPTQTPAPAGNSSAGNNNPGGNSNSTAGSASAPAAATAQPKAQSPAIIPQTSDAFPLEVLLAALTLSGAAAAALLLYRKKHNR